MRFRQQYTYIIKGSQGVETLTLVELLCELHEAG